MFQGSMVALVTPMHGDGRIDEAALARLIEFHIEAGTDAIVSVGTTGESPTLTPDEHVRVIHRTVELVAGRLPVIAGAGGNATAEAIHLARAAVDAGADATLQVTPYYNKPTQEGLYRHFAAVAEAVSCPHVVYNVPGRTAVDLLPDTVARLAAIDNIVAIKEATGNATRAREILDRCDEAFRVYSGEDASGLAVMLEGGHGVISVTANVAPAMMHDMCSQATGGDRGEAEALDARLSSLHAALFSQTNPIPVKWALAEMDLIGDGIRLPLVPLDEQFHETVREALRVVDVR